MKPRTFLIIAAIVGVGLVAFAVWPHSRIAHPFGVSLIKPLDPGVKVNRAAWPNNVTINSEGIVSIRTYLWTAGTITITNEGNSMMRVFSVTDPEIPIFANLPVVPKASNLNIPFGGKVIRPGEFMTSAVIITKGRFTNVVDISFSNVGVKQRIADWVVGSSNKFILGCIPGAWKTNIVQHSKEVTFRSNGMGLPGYLDPDFDFHPFHERLLIPPCNQNAP